MQQSESVQQPEGIGVPDAVEKVAVQPGFVAAVDYHADGKLQQEQAESDDGRHFYGERIE